MKQAEEKAKEYAFLLLKFRQRSCFEISQRLKNKKFSPEVTEKTVSFLKDKGFLDDRAFAGAWINSRLKKPYGLRRISRELQIKGVDTRLTDSLIQEVKQAYPENRIILQIAKTKLSRTKGIEPAKARQRVYGYLVRRGFDPEESARVLSEILNK